MITITVTVTFTHDIASPVFQPITMLQLRKMFWKITLPSQLRLFLLIHVLLICIDQSECLIMIIVSNDSSTSEITVTATATLTAVCFYINHVTQ